MFPEAFAAAGRRVRGRAADLVPGCLLKPAKVGCDPRDSSNASVGRWSASCCRSYGRRRRVGGGTARESDMVNLQGCSVFLRLPDLCVLKRGARTSL